MARGYIGSGGGNPNGSSDCTVVAGDVLKGKTYIGADTNDEVGTGTLELTGNAEDKYVYSGKTYYNTNAKEKRTGTMTVSSVVSFSVAAYSTDKVTATWQWPSIGPYSGVIICAKTGGYPGNINDGRVYTGTGSSYALGSKSSVIIGNLKSSTTYYFRIWVYCTVSGGDLYSGYKETTCATTNKGQQIFTSSGTFTVPVNVREIQIFSVGGGGGTSNGYTSDHKYQSGNGGGGGYTKTQKINVSPNQGCSVIVGAGGVSGGQNIAALNGQPSYIQINGINYCVANGGKGSYGAANGGGSSENLRGNGGSGGGSWIDGGISSGGNGGSDGNDGGYGSSLNGIGQHTTTRAFGELNNTLYAGGGGGSYQGIGGAGGGGNARTYDNGINSGQSGAANTGGGGGAYYGTSHRGAAGGSGIVIVRWGY